MALLIEGLPAEVVMADTAYDADSRRNLVREDREELSRRRHDSPIMLWIR